jgi:DNA-binding transcriptional regulator of glucitol operon
MKNKLYVLQGVVRQTNLREAIMIVAETPTQAIARANVIADNVVVERVEPLGENLK